MTISPQTGMPEVTLEECAHRPKFTSPPQKGELVWCVGCGQYRAVRETVITYRVNCLNCSLNRKYGSGTRLAPERLITEHRSKFPEHTVALMNGMRVERIISPENSGQQAIPTPDDAPPY